MFDVKLFDTSTERGRMELLRHCRDRLQTSADLDPESPYLKLQKARDAIVDQYLERREAAAQAQKKAQEEKEQEEDAFNNCKITFSYNVRGLSK